MDLQTGGWYDAPVQKLEPDQIEDAALTLALAFHEDPTLLILQLALAATPSPRRLAADPRTW